MSNKEENNDILIAEQFNADMPSHECDRSALKNILVILRNAQQGGKKQTRNLPRESIKHQTINQITISLEEQQRHMLHAYYNHTLSDQQLKQAYKAKRATANQISKIYWTQILKIKQSSVTNHLDLRICLQLSQELYSHLKFNSLVLSQSNKNNAIRMLFFNNAYCYFLLGQYKQSLVELSRAQELRTSEDSILQAIHQLKQKIHIKMGIKQTACSMQETQNQRTNDVIMQTAKLSSNSNQDLLQFMDKISRGNLKGNAQFSIVYNMGLNFKKRKLVDQSIQIFQFLLEQLKQAGYAAQSNRYRNHLNLLLSQLYQQKGNYLQSISYLKSVKLTNQLQQIQLQRKIIFLKRQRLVPFVKSSRAKEALKKSKQYHLLQQLQDQFSNLTKPTNENYKSKTKLLTKESLKSSTNKASSIRISTKQTSRKTLNSSKGSIQTQRNNQINHKSTTPKKDLRLNTCIAAQNQQKFSHSIGSSSQSISCRSIPSVASEKLCLQNYLSKFEKIEEKITELMIENNNQDAFKEIENITSKIEESCLEQNQGMLNFKMKCISWCKELGKQRFAIILLRKFINVYRANQKIDYQKLMMRELARIYEQEKEYRNVIELHNQLYRMGELQSLVKIGEINLVKQCYSQAISIFQQYDQIKNNAYSKVKLAYAYVKSLVQIKKGINILNQLLFSNKTSLIIKNFKSQEIADIQGAILLLSNIFVNTSCIKKGILICERYTQKYFGASSVYYLLGVMYQKQQDSKKAFQAYLNCLRIKPNHVPALVQILKLVKKNDPIDYAIIEILQKALLTDHRNWNLVLLFVEVLTGQNQTDKQMNPDNLIEFARIFETSTFIQGGFLVEAENLLFWVIELLDFHKRRRIIAEDQILQTIQIKLGDINILKGNYVASQNYYVRVLQRIQINKLAKFKNNTESIKKQALIFRKLSSVKEQQQQYLEAVDYLKNSYYLLLKNKLNNQALHDMQRIGQLEFHIGKYENCLSSLEKAREYIEITYISHHKFTSQQFLLRWVDICFKMAESYQKLNCNKQCKRTLHSILQHTMHQPTIVKLCTIYKKQGNAKMALEIVKSYLQFKSQGHKKSNEAQ